MKESADFCGESGGPVVAVTLFIVPPFKLRLRTPR